MVAHIFPSFNMPNHNLLCQRQPTSKETPPTASRTRVGKCHVADVVVEPKLQHISTMEDDASSLYCSTANYDTDPQNCVSVADGVINWLGCHKESTNTLRLNPTTLKIDKKQGLQNRLSDNKEISITEEKET